MKKTAWLLWIAAALCLNGCGTDQIQNDTGYAGKGEGAAITEIAAEAPLNGAEQTICETFWTDENLPVSAKAESGCYPPDTTEIRVTVTNRTDDEYSFPASAFQLFRMQNGTETDFPYADGKDCFTELAQIVMPHDTAVFTAHIAEHYDLPLPEGVYTIRIGELATGFEISADAEARNEQAQAQTIALSMVQTEYPAGTEQISVIITNNGSETADVLFENFGLEHTMDDCASYTPFHREPDAHVDDMRSVELTPGKSYTWNVSLSDFGSSQLSPGSYALIFCNQRADFTITD